MKSASENQFGYSYLELVLVFIVIFLVGAVGVLVYKIHNKSIASIAPTSSTKATSLKTTPDTSRAIVDPYAGWRTYTSKIGGFTLRFPPEWIIQGHNGINTCCPTTVPASQLNGSESSVDISSSTAKTNAFEEWIDIVNSPSSLSSLDAALNQIPFSQGSIINKLPNGIGIWLSGRTLTINGNSFSNAYPPAESSSNGQFGFKLNNGKYLDASLSFIVGPHGSGIGTKYSYDQQVNSPELQQGINILASVKQN